MTWIKICGITSPAAAEHVVRCRPSAIGLNFYAPSPRSVTAAVARSIRVLVPEDIEVIGVFVNESPETIAVIADEVGLTGIQLHGDETPADIVSFRSLMSINVCKAFRIGEDGLLPVHKFLEECERQQAIPDRILVDARVKGLYGGSGEQVDWTLVDASARNEICPPMILAGGLNPSNVAEAIRATSPWGVDVASGVEDSSGAKDVSLMTGFINCVAGGHNPPAPL